MLEQLARYLEGLGYTVEEQGTLAKYLVILKGSEPIGFLFPDISLRLVTGRTGEEETLARVIAFVRQNENLPLVGKSEYRLASCGESELTTFFDAGKGVERFSLYLPGGGEQKNAVYDNRAQAVRDFISLSGLMDLSALGKGHVPLSARLREFLLRRLLPREREGGS